jgi:hypothetical protein
MHTKHFIFTGTLAFIAFILIFAGTYYASPKSNELDTSEVGENAETIDQLGDQSIEEQRIGTGDRRALPLEGSPTPIEKIKADVFTGTLEVVDVGCFADGECFVEVGGKHVTVIMGWSQETGGTIQGVESFGDLEKYIGKKVEVYAHVREDGTYTLYGSEGFYIKLVDSTGDVEAPQTPVVSVPNGCVVGGCSGQVCGEASAQDDMMTTCEYRTEYACYQTAICERQVTGQCGWTETPNLRACLNTGGYETL